jgi:hypothetical protein
MKSLSWRIWIGIFLIVLSAVVYFIHFLVFRDAHHIFVYLVGDIGFVFIEVLLVTLIIDQLLHQREKRSLLHKLNMIIGVFFSDTTRIWSESAGNWWAKNGGARRGFLKPANGSAITTTRWTARRAGWKACATT